MSKDELLNFYEESKFFREYVDRFCKQHKTTIEEALEKKTVQLVGLHYKQNS